MMLSRITTFTGYAYDDHDGPHFVRDDTDHPRGETSLGIEDIAPPEAVSRDWMETERRRGCWRITVEFTPEES